MLSETAQTFTDSLLCFEGPMLSALVSPLLQTPLFNRRDELLTAAESELADLPAEDDEGTPAAESELADLPAEDDEGTPAAGLLARQDYSFDRSRGNLILCLYYVLNSLFSVSGRSYEKREDFNLNTGSIIVSALKVGREYYDVHFRSLKQLVGWQRHLLLNLPSRQTRYLRQSAARKYAKDVQSAIKHLSLEKQAELRALLGNLKSPRRVIKVIESGAMDVALKSLSPLREEEDSMEEEPKGFIGTIFGILGSLLSSDPLSILERDQGQALDKARENATREKVRQFTELLNALPEKWRDWMARELRSKEPLTVELVEEALERGIANVMERGVAYFGLPFYTRVICISGQLVGLGPLGSHEEFDASVTKLALRLSAPLCGVGTLQEEGGAIIWPENKKLWQVVGLAVLGLCSAVADATRVSERDVAGGMSDALEVWRESRGRMRECHEALARARAMLADVKTQMARGEGVLAERIQDAREQLRSAIRAWQEKSEEYPWLSADSGEAGTLLGR
jgi:gas vesicle protein